MLSFLKRRVTGMHNPMGGGGSGGGGSSTTVQEIPAELKPLASRYTQEATEMFDTPFQAYSGQRYADLNPTQYASLGMTADRALSGDQLLNAGYNYLGNSLTSGPRAATENPYGYISPAENNASILAKNNDSLITPGSNPYAGQNEYLQSQIDYALGDIGRNYNMTVSPRIAAANVRSGSFGNSGIGEMQAESQRQLANEMGRVASGMRFNDYIAQQGLAESALNRSMQAQQFNSGVADSNLARDMQAQLANLGTGEANTNRNMQAQQFNAGLGQDWAGRNDASYQNYLSNNMNALGMANTYGNQAYQDASQLLKAGQTLQDQEQQQKDFGFEEFMRQQNYPYQNLAAAAGVFGTNLGGTSKTESNQSSGGK